MHAVDGMPLGIANSGASVFHIFTVRGGAWDPYVNLHLPCVVFIRPLLHIGCCISCFEAEVRASQTFV